MAEGVLDAIVQRKRGELEERRTRSVIRSDPTRRSLRAALSRPGSRFIMEVKKASPSGHSSTTPLACAVRAYAGVADAISVLTDAAFSGSLDDLAAARRLYDGPILAKDFFIHPVQVTEARARGADAALVILSAVSDEEAAAILGEARRLAMDVIVEVHDERELGRALAMGADIIGINNRDLRTLKTDLAVTERLAPLVPPGPLIIGESGIRGRADAQRLASHVDAFLVGSALMGSSDISEEARALVYGRVKLCGITRMEDALFAADAGATHIGLVFAERSPRRVDSDPASIVAVARSLGLKVTGVFQDQPRELVERHAKDLALDAVQLHGREADLPSVRRALPHFCELWASCAVAEGAEPERAGADRIVYDSCVAGRSGGTGQAFDWSLVADRAQLPRSFVAGGIGPANARQAQHIGAHGIDVGSSIERKPGVKDDAKIRALFAALRLEYRAAEAC